MRTKSLSIISIVSIILTGCGTSPVNLPGSSTPTPTPTPSQISQTGIAKGYYSGTKTVTGKCTRLSGGQSVTDWDNSTSFENASFDGSGLLILNSSPLGVGDNITRGDGTFTDNTSDRIDFIVKEINLSQGRYEFVTTVTGHKFIVGVGVRNMSGENTTVYQKVDERTISYSEQYRWSCEGYEQYSYDLTATLVR